MAAEQDHGERKMNECGVTPDAAVPMSNRAFKLVEPGKCPPDFPPPFVATQWATVLTDRLEPILSVWRNQFDTTPCQLLIGRIIVAGAIPHRAPGSSRRDGFIERSLDQPRKE
ncbi:MAG TPA: hypothetical protein VF797_20810 [Noviherbaspirillum sp.]